MRKSISFLVFAALITVFTGCATQSKNKTTPSAKAPLPPGGTTAGVGMPGGAANPGGPSSSTPRATPKSFRTFFDQAKVKSQKGLIVIHWQDDKYYFEIPNALFGKDLLTVTRYVRMAAGAPIYGGEQTNQNVLRFERGPENKVFIRTVLNVISSPDSTKPIYQAVRNSNVDPIAAAFDIKAYNKDTTGVVIDVTDFLKEITRLYH